MEDTAKSAATRFIGIDVSKSSWDVHVLPDGRPFTVRTNDSACKRLLKLLGSQDRALVVLEATGG